MASTVETELVLELGESIRGLDGFCGRLTRLILDRGSATVTHAVITPGDERLPGRLVPIELLGGEPGDLKVNCTTDQIVKFEQAEYIETHLVPGHEPDGSPAPVELSMGLARGLEHRPDPDYLAVELQNVPTGAVQLTAGQRIRGVDGDLGTLTGIQIDVRTKELCHLLVRTHHGLRHHVVRVPAAAGLCTDNGLELRMTSRQIQVLPEIHDRHGLIRTS